MLNVTFHPLRWKYVKAFNHLAFFVCEYIFYYWSAWSALDFTLPPKSDFFARMRPRSVYCMAV